MSNIKIQVIPKDYPAFESEASNLPDSPEGAAAGMILALILYTHNPQDGEKALGLVVHPGQLNPASEVKSLSKRSLDLIKRQIGGKPAHMYSYFTGTSPQDSYNLENPPYGLDFSTNPHSGQPADGRVRLFIRSTGADSPRPITVQTDPDEKWKTAEWSSLLSGIRDL